MSVGIPVRQSVEHGAGGHYILVIPALDLVIVQRVNTDIKERCLESKEFSELMWRMLLAYKPPP